jgi:hypothetical protein
MKMVIPPSNERINHFSYDCIELENCINELNSLLQTSHESRSGLRLSVTNGSTRVKDP